MSSVEVPKREILRAAQAQLDAGHLDAAASGFRQILEAEPEDVDALGGLGGVAYQSHRYEEAVTYLSRAVAAQSLRVEDHNQLGLAYIALARNAEAQACLRKALEIAPDSIELLKTLGTAYAKDKDFEKASDFYRRAIALAPDFAEAYNNLGNVQKYLGQTERALESYRQALKKKPDLASAYQNMGALLAEQGKFDEAVEAFEAGLTYTPESWKIHLNLAKALSNLDRADESEAHYRTAITTVPEEVEPKIQLANHLFTHKKADQAVALLEEALESQPLNGKLHACIGYILQSSGDEEEGLFRARQAVEIDPRHHAYHNNLGVILQRQGQRADALSHFDRAVELAPKEPEAYCHIGSVLLDEGKLDKAAEKFQKSIELSPRFALAHTFLGSIYHRQDKPEAALEYHNKAVEYDPSLAIAHSNLGAVLQDQGLVDEALVRYRRALELEPNLIEARTNLGIALQETGKLDESEDAYLSVLRERPDFVPALRALMAVRTTTAKDEHVVRMEAMVGDEALTHDHRCDLHFALAKVYEDLKVYDQAFQMAEQANLYDKQARNLDIKGLDSFCDKTINVFTDTFFAMREGFGSTSEAPIFIIGLPRAGTTLVEQILSSHPSVHGGGELPYLPQVSRDIGKRFGRDSNYPEVLNEIDDEATRRLAADYLEKLTKGTGDVAHVTDKMPFNFMRLGLASLLIPKARIIHCRRDPLDVYVSGHFLKFKSALWFFSSIPDFVEYYKIYRTLMDHWERVLPCQILTVDYENMVRDQEAETRRLLDHCGLAWDDRCLDFHHNPRPVRTASNVQVRQPLYSYSIGHWQNYDRQLAPLKEALDSFANP